MSIHIINRATLRGALILWGSLQGGTAFAQSEPETADVSVGNMVPDAAIVDTVSENPVTESNDAFGQQVGLERTGLYSTNEVRGFNPVDAGNVRIESLYYDEVNRPSQRMLSSTTIRVGLSTQGYAFPAPTGLVDYSLRKSGDERSLNFEVTSRIGARELSTNQGFAWDLRVGNVLPGFGLASSGFFRAGQRQDNARQTRAFTGLVLTGDLPSGAELVAFGSYEISREDEARPTLFLAEDALPPQIERLRDFTQPWADSSTNTLITGAIASIPLGDFRIESGLFLSQRTDPTRFADLFRGVAPDGSVESRTIVADGDRLDRSISGEFRLVRAFSVGTTRHEIAASFRGRDRLRRFGGAQRLALGASTILGPDVREMPAYTLGEKNVDEVSQLFFGVAYSGRLSDWLSIDLGASQIDYSKTIDFVSEASTDLDVSTSPIAWNAATTLAVTDELTLFGSITRGMEEAEIAPDIATNRDEAPVAINTRQEEIVVSFAPSDALTLLAGAFQISKPYYNLDLSLRYRLLGTIVNKGLEFSAVARPIAGLTLIGGAVVSDPAVSGEIIDSGQIGPRPIGQPAVREIRNLDWRFADGASPLSVDVAFGYRGARTVNPANTFEVPGANEFDLGFRYRFGFDDVQMVLRGRLLNAFNTYDWDVSSSGGLFYTAPRYFQLQLNTEI